MTSPSTYFNPSPLFNIFLIIVFGKLPQRFPREDTAGAAEAEHLTAHGGTTAGEAGHEGPNDSGGRDTGGARPNAGFYWFCWGCIFWICFVLGFVSVFCFAIRVLVCLGFGWPFWCLFGVFQRRGLFEACWVMFKKLQLRKKHLSRRKKREEKKQEKYPLSFLKESERPDENGRLDVFSAGFLLQSLLFGS